MSKKHYVEEIISLFKSIHGERYDYSLINDYVNKDSKLPIVCHEHGLFNQSFSKHYSRKQGCPLCNGGIKKDVSYYIEKANEIHLNKYDYSKVNFINSKEKVIINCPIHGDFEMSFSNHCHATHPQGCPKCKQSKLELEIYKLLKENNIDFECQKKFDWLGKQSLDFYIPKYNVAIECQGLQHFNSCSRNSYFSKEKVDRIKELDKIKKSLCLEHNVKILYFSNIGIDYPYFVFEDKEELIKEIYSSETRT